MVVIKTSSSTARIRDSSGERRGGSGSSKSSSEKVVVDSSQGPVDLKTESYLSNAAETAKSKGLEAPSSQGGSPERYVVDSSQGPVSFVEESKKEIAKENATQSIAIDKAAVDRLNSGGLTAQDVFLYERYGNQAVVGPVKPSYVKDYNVREQVAPRSVSKDESSLPQYKQDERKVEEAVVVDDSIKGSAPKTFGQKVKDFFKERANKREGAFKEYKGVLAPVGFVGQAGTNFVGGVVESTQSAVVYGGQQAKGFVQDTGALIVNPSGATALALASRPANILGDVVGGTGEFIGDTVGDISRGDVLSLSGKAGEFASADRIFGGAGRGVKAAVNYPKARMFKRATEGAAKGPVEFTTSSFEFGGGRKGVLVPPSNQGLAGVRGAEVVPGVTILKAKELQTQLAPKRLNAAELEAYFKAEGFGEVKGYEPLKLSELAQKEPQLAKELAMESGQTVFNPNEPVRVRSLTPEEALLESKRQAGVGSGELQKTLGSYPPTGPDFTILKNNEAIGKVQGKTISLFDNRKGQLGGGARTEQLFRDADIIGDSLRKGVRKIEKGAIELSKPENLAKARELPVIKSLPKASNIPSFRSGLTPDNIIKSNDKSDVLALPKIGSSPVSITKPKQLSGLRTESASLQDQNIRQEQIPVLDQPSRLKQFERQRLNSEERIIEETKIRLPDDKRGQSNKKPLGFINVQIRRGGKFRTIGTTEDVKSAFELGKTATRRSAAASFRVIGSQGELASSPNGLGPEFRASKRESGVFIQKAKFRISSSEEKAEITRRGQLASSLRRKNRGVL